MSTPDFSALVARHRAYFRTGATRSTVWRQGQLTALRAMMTERAQDFHAALWTDLRRNRTDADLTDLRHCLRAEPYTTEEGTIGWISSSRLLFW
jgi:aldehyde dehydrogenase (NAD+)